MCILVYHLYGITNTGAIVTSWYIFIITYMNYDMCNLICTCLLYDCIFVNLSKNGRRNEKEDGGGSRKTVWGYNAINVGRLATYDGQY